MSLVDLSVDDVFHTKCIKDGKDEYDWTKYRYEYYISPKFKINPEHTYMIVFGPEQTEEQKVFEEAFKDNIIFKGKKALNNNHDGHYARNTLFFFE